MKHSIKLFCTIAVLAIGITACGDDDDDKPAAATPTTPVSNTNPTVYTVLGTDPTGDANGGLDVLETAYLYDDSLDIIKFRVKLANLSAHSTNPSVDFNFVLPNGTANNDALASPFSGTIMTHKTIHVYTDDGGTAPSTYTYTNKADFAVNGVNLTKDTQAAADGNDLDGICSDCVSLNVDVANNTIVIELDRKKLITDAEVGSSKAAKLKMSSGVGQARRGSDTGTNGVEFTIYTK